MSRGAGGCRSEPGHCIPANRIMTGLCCILVLGLMSRVATAEPNERGLWLLWSQHATNASDHEALLTECQAFTNKNPSDPFVVVGRSLAAWNLLQLGRQAEAVAILKKQLDGSGSPLDGGAASLAKAWLTRLDRERVKAALQFYYRREVRYPRSLDELLAYAPLPKNLAPPRQDRWGTNWRYTLVGFKSMPGLMDQKYEISAAGLGGGADLAAALAVPYADLIHVRPNRMLSSKPGGEIVEWMTERPASEPPGAAKPAGQTMALGVNSTAEGMSVVYIGRTILIVHDNYHWKLFVRPAG